MKGAFATLAFVASAAADYGYAPVKSSSASSSTPAAATWPSKGPYGAYKVSSSSSAVASPIRPSKSASWDEDCDDDATWPADPVAAASYKPTWSKAAAPVAPVKNACAPVSAYCFER